MPDEILNFTKHADVFSLAGGTVCAADQASEIPALEYRWQGRFKRTEFDPSMAPQLRGWKRGGRGE